MTAETSLDSRTDAEPQAANRRALVACILLIVFGIGLRFWNLSRESLWYDEGYAAWMSGLPPLNMLRAATVDTAPPLHYLLLHGWREIFGDGEASLRGFSALAAALTMLFVFAISREILRDRVAVILATALSAVSVLQIRYAQEARFYSMTALLAALAFLFLLRFLKRPKRMTFYALAITLAVGLYTQNIMFFYLAAIDVAWLVLPGDQPLRRRVRDIVWANVIVAGIYLPWLPIFLRQTSAIQGNFWLSPPKLWDGIVTTASVLGVTNNPPKWQIWVMIGLFVALFLMVVKRRETIALVIVIVGPLVVTFLYSLVRQPIFMERVFVASSAFVPILIAIPVARCSKRWIAISFAIAILALSGWSSFCFMQADLKEQWREAAKDILDHQRADRLLVFVGNEGEILYDYYVDLLAPRPRMIEAKIGLPQGFYDLDPPRTMRRVLVNGDIRLLADAVASGKYQHITYVRAHTTWADPEDLTLKYLQTSKRFVEKKEYRGIDVIEFD